jgi:hypothetical protein
MVITLHIYVFAIEYRFNIHRRVTQVVVFWVLSDTGRDRIRQIRTKGFSICCHFSEMQILSSLDLGDLESEE